VQAVPIIDWQRGGFSKGFSIMYARTQNNAIAADLLAAVCKARSRNFLAARLRAAFAGYLA